MQRTVAIFLFAFVCSLAAADKPPKLRDFSVPPYFTLTPDGAHMAVSWAYTGGETPKDVEFKLKCGDPEKPTKLAPLGNPKEHKVYHVSLPTSLLNSSEACVYRISGMEKKVWLPLPSFPRHSRTLHFSFLSDTHGNDSDVFRQLTEIARGSEPNFVLHGGDFVNDPDDDEQWQTVWQAGQNLFARTLLIQAMGNNDISIEQKRHHSWQDWFHELPEQAFGEMTVGPLQIIRLNTNFTRDEGLAKRQLEWFRTVTQDRQTPWRIVLMHHSAVSREAEKVPDIQSILMEMYVPAFEKAGVDVVLSGHQHFYQNIQPTTKGCVSYLIGGPSGGDSKRAWDTFTNHISPTHRTNMTGPEHSTVSHFEVTRNRLSWKTYNHRGNLLDDFKLTHPVKSVPAE